MTRVWSSDKLRFPRSEIRPKSRTRALPTHTNCLSHIRQHLNLCTFVTFGIVNIQYNKLCSRPTSFTYLVNGTQSIVHCKTVSVLVIIGCVSALSQYIRITVTFTIETSPHAQNSNNMFLNLETDSFICVMSTLCYLYLHNI